MQVVAPICVYCKHFEKNENAESLTCKAFPGGIPIAILHSRHDHRQPYEGDGGVTFDLSPNVSRASFDGLLRLLSLP